MLLNKKNPSKDAIIYIIMQCIGAIFASMMLLAIMSGFPGYDIATSNLRAIG
jgi:glycerol uptake facilitator-like aquaporin